MANETELIKVLREKTGAGVLNCRAALKESSWDVEKAVEALRKKGLEIAARKSGRATKAGKVDSYIHMGGKIGVMVEADCETDFVARNEEFGRFVRDIAMQVAATAACYVDKPDVPGDLIEREKGIYRESIQGKPPAVIEKIVEGKLSKFYEEVCLLEQFFIKDDKIKVRQVLNDLIAKTGENIVIKRFVKFVLGES